MSRVIDMGWLAARAVHLDDRKVFLLRQVFPIGKLQIQATKVEVRNAAADLIDGLHELVSDHVAAVDEFGAAAMIAIGNGGLPDPTCKYNVKNPAVLLCQY